MHQFVHDRCSEGACIVVKDQLVSGGFPQQLYNPQCFLQYEIPILPAGAWNVSSLSSQLLLNCYNVTTTRVHVYTDVNVVNLGYSQLHCLDPTGHVAALPYSHIQLLYYT